MRPVAACTRHLKLLTDSTLADCAEALGCDTSTMCMRSVDDSISSSVAWNAAMSCVGSFCIRQKHHKLLSDGLKVDLHYFWRDTAVQVTCMNPTVSVSSTSLPDGRERRRVVGSSVAKSLSSASTPAAVSRFSSVLLPVNQSTEHHCKHWGQEIIMRTASAVACAPAFV